MPRSLILRPDGVVSEALGDEVMLMALPDSVVLVGSGVMDAFSTAVLFTFATGRLVLSFGRDKLVDAGGAFSLFEVGED
jgi:hypothetical protein